MSFDLDQFVADCRQAAAGDDGFEAVQLLMKQVMDNPEAVARAVPENTGEPECAGDLVLGYEKILFEDETVTIFLVDSLATTLQPPHDHQISAVIGVYEGVERNRFFARENGGIRLAGEKHLAPGDVLGIRPDTVHAISADASGRCRALHVYLGPLSLVDRTLFDPASGKPEAFRYARYLELCAPDSDA